MSFSEYNGTKTTVSQTVGRIFKNAQGNFPKIQTPQAIGALLKTISPVGSGNACEHERLNKSISPSSNLSSSKFGLQKFRLRAGGSEKKRSNKHHAELLDNQEVGDHEGSGDETDFLQHCSPCSHLALIDSPTGSSPISQKQKRWPF